ncbi:ABC transporter permease [uncultured Bacteroides sp.]|uniref:ABC transporter permease n=1 Tax=uncultured Bacteroides sp. TaxID=162156 RepID=UPI002AAB7F7E|nr:ABC transporter permease [uncultured Bacteroides sp.]
MKQFRIFVKKEFLHIFRDRRTMMILLGMPIIEIILFGFAISTEVKNVRVGVLDPSGDVISRKIIDRVDASEYFTLTDNLHTPQEMEEAFRQGEIDLAIVFSPRFFDNLYTGDAKIQLVADASDPNMAVTRSGYASGIIVAAEQELLPPGATPATIVSDVRLLYNPQMKSAYNFVPGVMGLILMLICAMMTSISIVREKEIGTMEVLLVSPMRSLLIILSKAVPYFVLSCINLSTILLLSVYVLHVPIAGSLISLVAVSLLFIFVSLLLGLFISTITHTQIAAMLVSGLMLMMPTMLLSGMVFPIDGMPTILQVISTFIPARWYIDIVRKVMIEGVSIVLVAKEIAILSLMALVLIIVSLKKFKIRLE